MNFKIFQNADILISPTLPPPTPVRSHLHLTDPLQPRPPLPPLIRTSFMDGPYHVGKTCFVKIRKKVILEHQSQLFPSEGVLLTLSVTEKVKNSILRFQIFHKLQTSIFREPQMQSLSIGASFERLSNIL